MKKKHTRRLIPRCILYLLILLLLSVEPVLYGSGSTAPPHFLPENGERYESYISANPTLSYDTAVAYVNAHVDEIFYSDVVTVENPASTLVFCTKNSALPSDYIPANLVSVSGSQKLRADAAESFIKMRELAQLAGLNLIVYSAYRSYGSQKSVYESYLRGNGQAADSYSARPGHSEHQTGLAIDILHISGSKGFRSARFQNTAEYEWLTQNAHKYGFILRYPNGYQDITGYIFEPWHWRYVGVHAATVMFDEKIATFEEYFGRYLVSAQKTGSQPDIPVYYSAAMGVETAVLESYVNSGDNLFKIRDIAYLLRDTPVRFDIGWNGDAAAVLIFSKTPYNASGTELSRTGKAAAPMLSDITVYRDGDALSLAVYTSDGNSYVSLRELSEVLGFSVSFDDESFEFHINEQNFA